MGVQAEPGVRPPRAWVLGLCRERWEGWEAGLQGQAKGTGTLVATRCICPGTQGQGCGSARGLPAVSGTGTIYVHISHPRRLRGHSGC